MLPLLLSLVSACADGTVDDSPAPDPWKLEGDLAIGWRFVGIDGNRARIAEAGDATDGARLVDLRLAGERRDDGGALRAFEISASEVGSTHSAAHAGARFTGLEIAADARRDEFSADAQDDVHAFDETREVASLCVSTRSADDEPRASVTATAGRRSGIAIDSRSVDFGFVRGFPARRAEDVFGVDGDVAAPIAGFDVDVGAGIEHIGSRGAFDFRLRSPSAPSAAQSEDFDEDDDATTRHVDVRVSRSMDDGRFVVDGGAQFTNTHGSGRFHSFEDGVLFAADDPFQRTTDGTAVLDSHERELDVGARAKLGADVVVRARVRRITAEDDGSNERLRTTTEGGSTSSLVQADGLHVASERTVFELGGGVPLSDAVDLDVDASYGSVHASVLETADEVQAHVFDGDLTERGISARLSIGTSAASTLTLSADAERTPTKSAFGQFLVDYGLDRIVSAAARWRWKPRPGVTLETSVRHTERENDVFDSETAANVVALTARLAPSSAWDVSASWSLREQTGEAHPLEVLPMPTATLVPVTIDVAVVTNVGTLALSGRLGARCRPRVAASVAVAHGDVRFDYAVLDLDVPWRAGRNWTLGVQCEFLRFDGDDALGSQDATERAALAYVRFDL